MKPWSKEGFNEVIKWAKREIKANPKNAQYINQMVLLCKLKGVEE